MLPVQPDFADITVVVFGDDKNVTLVLITIKLNVYEYN